MKYLLVMVMALVAIVAADEEWKPVRDKQVLDEIIDDCVRESGIKLKQIRNIDEHSDDKETPAYVVCRVKKLGLFTEDKGYSVDRIISQLDVFYEDAEKVRDIVTNCVHSSEQYSTPGLKALYGERCLRNSGFSKMLKERNEKL